MTTAGDPCLMDEKQALLEQGLGRILLFHLIGPMSFAAAKAISQQMTILKDYDVLILDLENVPFLGVTTSLAVETMVHEAY